MKGKVAIVTASSTGIGKGVVFRLAEEGCAVVVSSRNQKHVDATVSELQKKGYEALGVVCHVGKKEDRENLIQKTLEKYGRIDYFVANAAVSTHMGSFFEANEKQVMKMWEINYLATFMFIKEVVPHLAKQPDSAIVVLSSYTGYELSNMIGHYAVTKTALLGLVKLLAAELQEQGIRVNGVAPGLIKTEFSKELWKHGEKESAEMMGAKRLGEPRDIANLVKFLLSEEASYITGENVCAAGRLVSRL